MATQKLTATRVDRFKFDPTGSKIQRLWDSEVSGLGVEVFPSGKKSWVFRYRLHKKQSIIAIGSVSVMDLKAARKAALRYHGLVIDGLDPKAARDAPSEGCTLDEVYEDYIGTRYFQTRSEDFQNNLKSTYGKYLKADLGHYPVKAIRRAQVAAKVDALIEEGKEGAARGLLNRAKILFSHAIRKDWLENSPADHIKPSYTTKGRRTKWLQSEEVLREAWWFSGAPQTRALIRWCLLTGCRRDEARETRRDWIDDECWRVPDTKNSRELVLPMMPAMRGVVQEMKATFGATGWLFPATTDTHKVLPRGTLDYMIRQGTRGRWSLHVLRHTVETYLRELEVAEETRDLILNHVRESSGSRYGHGRALELKRAGLEVWHGFLLGKVESETQKEMDSNVIALGVHECS